MTISTGSTACDVYGAGPPVIMIHGLGLNRDMWQWQRGALERHFRVICYDLLGHGDSAKPTGRYLMKHMVDQVSALMDDLDVAGAALVGFSLGGLIARAFALAHPDRVTALAILNSAHARTPEQREGVMRRVREAEAGGPGATVEAALARWFNREFISTCPGVPALVREWVRANDPVVYPAVYRLLAEGDVGLESVISEIKCPTLVMTAELDHGNSPSMAAEMAALIPDARCIILPGLKHMALAEDPDAVNLPLVSFLCETLLHGTDDTTTLPQ